MKPIPVTVLTGFLGSGKTTLLTHILTASHGLRIGVLFNELGEIALDSRLITARGEDVLELVNGCVCCTTRDHLLAAVAALLERPRPPEHLVIETTGLADPAQVAQQLLDPGVRNDIHLKAIITLVDAANFDRSLEHAEEAHGQITTGDILLVNKTDLVTPEVVDQIETRLRAHNPRARIMRCQHARVDLDLIVGLDLFTLASPAARREEPRAHDRHIRAVAYRAPAPLDLRRFAGVIDQAPAEIIRAKGILSVAGAPVRVIFQLVGGRWTVITGEAWRPDEERVTEMTFVGKNLSTPAWEALERRLDECQVTLWT